MNQLEMADEMARRLSYFAGKVYIPLGEDGCWFWTGTRKDTGYGRFWNGTHLVPAHRWAWELRNGPVPSGLELDHRCRSRDCVNPAHLEPVTKSENVRRSSSWHHWVEKAAARTHCAHGHDWVPENIYQRGRQKECRLCRQARNDAKRVRR